MNTDRLNNAITAKNIDIDIIRAQALLQEMDHAGPSRHYTQTQNGHYPMNIISKMLLRTLASSKCEPASCSACMPNAGYGRLTKIDTSLGLFIEVIVFS